MSYEANVAAVRTMADAINSGDLGVFDDLFAEDFQEHLNVDGATSGRDGARQFIEQIRASFPDFHATHDFVVGDDSIVVSRVVFTGTHLGDTTGLPATGQPVTVQGVEIYRFDDGQIVERWGEFDQLGMLIQMGVIPMPDDQ